MIETRNSRIFRIAHLMLIIILLCSFACGKVIYVDDDTAGANDGTSWADAYNFLQDALADANDSDKPVEIRVAQGVYKPDQRANQTPGDREATFRLINGVALKGGYAGFDEPDPNLRDIKLYETILNGDLNSDDVEVSDPCDLAGEVTRAENSYHIVTGSGTDEKAVLDGFTIIAGNANDESNYGGGMYNVFGSPTLTYCTFSGNLAKRGGGMYNLNSSPTLTNCTFSGNSASTVWGSSVGGGMFNSKSSPILTECLFSGNWAGFGGGGMWNDDDSYPIVTNCTFSENSVNMVGGGMFNSSSHPILANCTFHKNLAGSVSFKGTGGGMYNSHSSPSLNDCTCSENSAYWAGGGMYNMSSDRSTLTNCIFNQNSSLGGGGMFNEVCDPTLNNCVFIENSAEWAGGLYNWQSSPALSNCTFSDNFSERGGGIYNMESNSTLTNCIFSGNSALLEGGGIWNNTNS
ncbi:MAG: right-handed parallel beta-helix repeat-containing protein [Phycisphaerales bacterium]